MRLLYRDWWHLQLLRVLWKLQDLDLWLRPQVWRPFAHRDDPVAIKASRAFERHWRWTHWPASYDALWPLLRLRYPGRAIVEDGIMDLIWMWDQRGGRLVVGYEEAVARSLEGREP